MKEKEYWHEISQKRQEEILRTPNLTVQEFLDTYSQPEWCGYDDALDGAMGCWSLLFSKSIRCEQDCGDCDCKKTPN